MIVTINASAESKEFLKTLLMNSGIQPLIEPAKTADEPLKMTIAETIANGLILLQVIEASPEAFSGEIMSQNGRRFSLDADGRAKLREAITNAMKQPSQAQQPPAWTYFIPEIRAFLNEIIGLIRWYPKAIGKSQHQITKNFLILIGLSVLGVGVLTFVGRVSGDAFVFVIGILLGYLFAFLNKYLGLAGEGS